MSFRCCRRTSSRSCSTSSRASTASSRYYRHRTAPVPSHRPSYPPDCLPASPVCPGLTSVPSLPPSPLPRCVPIYLSIRTTVWTCSRPSSGGSRRLPACLPAARWADRWWCCRCVSRGVEEQEALFTQGLVAHANELLERATADGLPEDLPGKQLPPTTYRLAGWLAGRAAEGGPSWMDGWAEEDPAVCVLLLLLDRGGGDAADGPGLADGDGQRRARQPRERDPQEGGRDPGPRGGRIQLGRQPLPGGGQDTEQEQVRAWCGGSREGRRSSLSSARQPGILDSGHSWA